MGIWVFGAVEVVAAVIGGGIALLGTGVLFLQSSAQRKADRRAYRDQQAVTAAETFRQELSPVHAAFLTQLQTFADTQADIGRLEWRRHQLVEAYADDVRGPEYELGLSQLSEQQEPLQTQADSAEGEITRLRDEISAMAGHNFVEHYREAWRAAVRLRTEFTPDGVPQNVGAFDEAKRTLNAAYRARVELPSPPST